MSYMFKDNIEMGNIDLTDWDLSNVATMEKMFAYCYRLERVTGLKNLNNCYDMMNMFQGCDNLTTVDISGSCGVNHLSGMFD